MNSYLLTRLFYGELEKSEDMQRHCSPHHQALFFRIIQVQNQVGWQVKTIGLPTENTMFFTCISNFKTYKKCLIDLVAWGLIEEISPAKNQHQARQISLHTEKWSALFTQASPEQGQGTARANTIADTHASSTHYQGTDQSTTKASPPYKTSKLLNLETSKPLNLETSKEGDLAETIKSSENEISSALEINYSLEDNAVNRFEKESLPPQEKKKVAPKRKQSIPKPDLLFKDSAFADKSLFIAAFKDSEYERANLDYYYEIVKNWSESKQALKKDWIATVKNWMLKDFKEGKLVSYEPSSYAQSKATDTAPASGYTVLGNTVDQYFERKYGK